MSIKEKLQEFWYKNFSTTYQKITQIKIQLNYQTAEGNTLLGREINIEPRKPLYCEEDSWNQSKREVAREYCERDHINNQITSHCDGFYKKIKKQKYAVGMYRKFETSILKGFSWEISRIITENLSYKEYLKHKGELHGMS